MIIKNDNKYQYVELLTWLENDKRFENPPNNDFLYNPRRGNDFSFVGEEMVENLVTLGLPVNEIFNKMLPISKQKEVAHSCFEKFKGTVHDKPGKKGQMGYFRTQRSFGSLTPSIYKRTPNAPRLTAKGNSFHGMNKALLIEIIKDITKDLQNYKNFINTMGKYLTNFK